MPSPADRQALEVAAHTRWTTEDLLNTALTEAGGSPAGVFDWLRRRPFVQSEGGGVCPEPLVRDLVDAVADPSAAAAWQHAQGTRPLRPQEHLMLARVHADPAAHRAASTPMDLVVHRILATFILATPVWSFIGLASGSFLDPLMRYIDQRPVSPPVVVDQRSFTLYAYDWRAVTIERWTEVGHLAELAGPEARTAARPRIGPGALTVLTREEFDAAVGDALTAWQRKDLLAGNPLLRTRLVTAHGGDDPVEALREVITEALDAWPPIRVPRSTTGRS